MTNQTNDGLASSVAVTAGDGLVGDMEFVGNAGIVYVPNITKLPLITRPHTHWHMNKLIMCPVLHKFIANDETSLLSLIHVHAHITYTIILCISLALCVKYLSSYDQYFVSYFDG